MSKEQENDNLQINLDFFMDENNKDLQLSTTTPPTKKRRGRPKKIKEGPDGAIMVADEKSSNLPMWQSNEAYIDTYGETTGLLRGTIAEIDTMSRDLRGDIDHVRNSKTIRKKYDYLSNMVGTEGALISSKIAAIKEINKSITDANNLDLKRMGGVAKLGLDQDDTKVITDMYNAFVQTPIGDGANPFGFPSQVDMSAGSGIQRAQLSKGDMGYDQYINNPTLEQATVQNSTNPNLETVVIQDENAPVGQQIYFDIIDKTTGQSVPGVERPAPMFLENLRIEPELGLAVDNNLNMTYTLINKAGNASPTLGQY